MIAMVFLMHAFLSAIFPIGRAAVKISQPVFFTGVRMFLAGIILLMYQWYQHGRFSGNFKRLLYPLAVFTLTGIYLTNVPEFWALQWVPAAKASFIYSLSPFAAALFSYFFFHEKMTWKKVIGMAIGLFGFSIMIYFNQPGEIMHYSIGFLNSGEIGLIVAAIATAYGWIVMRKMMKSHLCTPAEAIGFSMLVGGILALMQSSITEQWEPIPVSNLSYFLLYVSLAVIFSSVLGYILYPILLREYTVTFLSFAGFVEPLCAALMAWLFLGEVVTWRFFMASFLVFWGLYIFYQEELKLGYIVKKKRT